MYWGGRPVPAGQVSGLSIGAEHRDRGAASELLHAYLAEVYERGAALSTLFPAAVQLYRQAGYEYAGTWTLYETAARHLPAGWPDGWGQGHGPAAVLACLPGEQHDLGLLAFGITLQRRGWRIIYLGPDTPIATIHHAIGRIAPDLVVLTGTVPEPFATHADAIADLARHTTVALGGAGATAGLAAQTGTRLLDTDPVTAAERLGQIMPGTQAR